MRGFTLLELVVYIAILALITAGAVRLILASSFNLGEIKSERKIIAGGELALESLVREIRLASSVQTSSSVFGQNPSTLVLNTVLAPGSQSAVQRTFTLSSSRLTRQDSGGPLEYATSQDVTITDLTFWHKAVTTSALVTIKLTLEAGQGRFKESKTFYGSAVLRESY